MSKPNITGSVLEGIPEIELESLARVLYEPIREYLSSAQGKKDYEEWIRSGQSDRQNKNYTYNL